MDAPPGTGVDGESHTQCRLNRSDTLVLAEISVFQDAISQLVQIVTGCGSHGDTGARGPAGTDRP
jgi:hypothetical protein